MLAVYIALCPLASTRFHASTRHMTKRRKTLCHISAEPRAHNDLACTSLRWESYLHGDVQRVTADHKGSLHAISVLEWCLAGKPEGCLAHLIRGEPCVERRPPGMRLLA